MIRPHPFVFHNGRTARSAGDILQVLTEGPIECFTDHVVHGEHPRNDFASWAHSSLKEDVLAARLREAHTRDDTIAALQSWLEPHKLRRTVHGNASKTDFMLGFATGIVLSILLMAVVAMLK